MPLVIRDNMLSYGMGPKKLWLKLNNEGYPISFYECETMFQDYKSTFPEATQYLRKLGEAAFNKCYAATKYGRKRYFNKPSYVPDYSATQLGYDNRTPESRKLLSPDQIEILDKVEAYNAQKGAIQREGANHVIQGGNADITKLAMKLIQDKLIKGGYHAHFSNMVYDEIILSAPDSEVPEVEEIQKSCMLEAEQYFLEFIPAEAEGGPSQVWTKD